MLLRNFILDIKTSHKCEGRGFRRVRYQVFLTLMCEVTNLTFRGMIVCFCMHLEDANFCFIIACLNWPQSGGRTVHPLLKHLELSREFSITETG
jgi:hypothetical protein